ncbi:SEL1-like repeat protein [Leisingera sp. NJS204]|uniref:SEL1-like repeat protein n=1 Tax=Leisingera sp. NJS204 TaxID=2508307 RepID=UPI0013E953F1|nr:tetratricopeptide repeat protein [Leisingera sp. NJS204]
MTLFRFAPLCLILAAAPLCLRAQEAAPATPETAAASQDALTMAEVEQAWAAKDFARVRQGLAQLAAAPGAAFAQYRYGRVLLEGLGGPADPAAAQGWLQRAAEQGQTQAAVLLARLYLSAVPGGPARDPVQAAQLLLAAGARGSSEAQYYLGLLHQTGEGVAQDVASAAAWLQAAAEQGHSAAQFELSRIYSRGQGVAQDTARALHWLQEAAAAGHGEAQFYLAYALDSGQGIGRDRAAALDWLRRAGEGGFVPAQAALGRKYLKGDGAEADPAGALRWLHSAAEAGEGSAMAALGEAYLGAYGVPEDVPQAWQLYRSAWERGLPQAAVGLAGMLEQGRGRDPDLEQAVILYRKAAELGSHAAELNLGRLAGAGRLDGLLAPHRAVPWALVAARQGDTAAEAWMAQQAAAGLRPAQTALGLRLTETGARPAEAAALFEAAAAAGDSAAQHQLGLLYTKGLGRDQDYVQAYKWLNIAAASGSAGALKTRAVVADLMTAEQVAEAQAAARAFLAAATAPAGQAAE